jgi:polyisoprenoid-binding protein YceI
MTPRTQPVTPSAGPGSGRGPVRPAVLAVVAGLLVAGIVGAAYGAWYLFLSPPPPAAVGSAAPVIPSDAPVGAVASTDGTWAVDTGIGSFDDFSGTFVGYRVVEELVSLGVKEAYGRTPDVSGSLTLAGTTVTDAQITADLATLRSDDSRRDGQLSRQALETARFPTATFTLTEPIELDAVPGDGESVDVTAVGDLTIHGVTRSVAIPLHVTRDGDVVAVSGSLDITFADHGMDRPQSFMVLSVEDHGIMELQVFFRQA